jgi:hypothetical protein
VNRLIIERNPSQVFDPATLQWNVTTPGTPVNVTLTDSGTGFDAATGDGIYTGTFTPTSAGTYTAVLSVTGTSLAGNSFSRTAATQFQVSQQQLASFSAFSDAQQSSAVTVTASVNVQTTGTYRLTMQLQAGNQNVVQGGSLLNLAAGSQQIPVTFSNSQLFGLGVNGPYERVNALLVYVGTSGDLIADSRTDAGPTGAYTLSSFAPLVYFTGQNSAAGVITGAGPTFDLLRVQIGINNSSGFGTCLWSATLTDALGNRITSSSASGPVASGNTSLTLDFNGLRIAAVGTVPYPYTVKGASVICGTSEASAANLFTISGFSASQFTYVTPDFTLSLIGSTPSGSPGSSIAFPLSLTSVGGFVGEVFFSVTGLPTGATGSFSVPSVFGSGFSTLTVATPANLSPGTYPFTASYTSGTTSKSLPLTLNIIAPVSTPTFSPAPGTYTTAQTVTIGTTTTGASIRYTTDGSTPSETGGTLYSGPITVSSTTTIKAIAYESGLADSNVVSATFTIQTQVANPAFNPAAGTYSSAQNVTIGTATAGASIRYTTDGSAPSETAGTLYTGPIAVSGRTTLNAIAYASGLADSAIVSATYTFNPTVTFTGAPASAAYLSTFTVTATANASTTATIASSGGCSIGGNVVTMTSAAGTCQLTANWAADQNFLAASATQSTTATKAAATVNLNTASLSQTYNGTAKSVTATTNPSGLLINIAYNGANTAPINAGSYSVIATINDPNYQGTASGTLQINKATLTVTANNASRTYGVANPTFSASYGGFVNGETFGTAVTGSPSLTTTATASSLPGSYPIVAAQGTLSAANYAFSFVNGTLTMTPTAASPASGATCNGAYNSTFNGNVTISSGQTCIFVSGGITGNVTVNGGSLTLSNATVGGNVTGQGNVTITGTAHVNGNVTLSGGQLSASGGAIGGSVTLNGGSSLTLGSASVGGSLVMNSGGTFSIGPSAAINGSLTIQAGPAGSAQNQVCGANVKGNATLQSNAGAVQIGSAVPSACAGNTIGGNLVVQQNTGSIGVFANAVTGNLVCQNNSSITGNGNTARLKEGQCAGF